VKLLITEQVQFWGKLTFVPYENDNYESFGHNFGNRRGDENPEEDEEKTLHIGLGKLNAIILIGISDAFSDASDNTLAFDFFRGIQDLTMT